MLPISLVADIIPGVSGSTITLIIGIYEEMLETIQAFDIAAFCLFREGQFKALWYHLYGPFFLLLVGGIGLRMSTTVQLVTYLLENYSI